jgi:hypothetical protein
MDREPFVYDNRDTRCLEGSAAAPPGAGRATRGRARARPGAPGAPVRVRCGMGGQAGKSAARARPRQTGWGQAAWRGGAALGNSARLVHGADEHALREGGLAVEVGDGAVALARAYSARVRPRAEQVHAAQPAA